MSKPAEEEANLSEDSEVASPVPEAYKAKWAKVTLTVALVASYICLACKRSIVGPTAMNLAQMVNTTEKEIPIVFTLRSFGYVLGFAIGGIFWDKVTTSVYRHTLMVVVNFLSGVLSLAVPFCRRLSILGVTFISSGVFLGILDIGLNVYFLHIWHGESPRYYQTLHFSYALGYLIGPIIARIFIEDVQSGRSDYVKLPNIEMPAMPRIIYAYVILCLMFATAACIWLVICILHLTPSKPKKIKQTLLKEPSSKFRHFAVISTCILLFLDGSIELGYQHILATFAFTKYGVSAVHSADITTMFWGFFAIGSLITIILAGMFHPHILILCNNLIEIVAGLIFLLFVERTNQYLAFGNCLLGLGASTLFSNTILWYDSYITITVKTMGAFLMCNVVAEMVVPELLSFVMRADHEPVAIFLTIVPILFLIIFYLQCAVFFPTGEKYPTDFGKPGKRSSRKRICPIFLFTRLKTREDIEDAISPQPDPQEEAKPGPLDPKKSSKEKQKQSPKEKKAKKTMAAAAPEPAKKEEEEPEEEEGEQSVQRPNVWFLREASEKEEDEEPAKDSKQKKGKKSKPLFGGKAPEEEEKQENEPEKNDKEEKAKEDDKQKEDEKEKKGKKDENEKSSKGFEGNDREMESSGRRNSK